MMPYQPNIFTSRYKLIESCFVGKTTTYTVSIKRKKNRGIFERVTRTIIVADGSAYIDTANNAIYYHPDDRERIKDILTGLSL